MTCQPQLPGERQEVSADPTLYAIFMDRVVRHKMDQQSIEIEAEWLDDNDMIDFERLPGRLRGPVHSMRRNAMDLVDSLMGALQSRLR